MTWAFDRRSVLTGLGAATLTSALPARGQSVTARLIVVGGGFGGATAARRLKQLQPTASVTLIEPNRTYTACPFSNLVIAGERAMSEQVFTYDRIASEGVELVHQIAVSVDSAARTVTLEDGSILGYDRLILSPGIEFRWNALEGYDEAAAELMPHAWKAGPQTTLLQQKLAALEDGEPVIMVVPPAPFRCPPGPYERASLIAHHLKTRKPRSKLIVLDAKDSFSKMALFQEAWAQHYSNHLEWRGASDDGRVSRVNAASMSISTDFEEMSASVINVIPPQRAGAIARAADVADATGWCPINPVTFESKLVEGIHVIGDATIAAPMPKSAFSANLQGKLCAHAVSQILNGYDPEATILANTCYSFTTPQQAVSIVGVYNNGAGQFESIAGAGGLSPLAAPTEVRKTEAEQARNWFSAITGEAFG